MSRIMNALFGKPKRDTKLEDTLRAAEETVKMHERRLTAFVDSEQPPPKVASFKSELVAIQEEAARTATELFKLHLLRKIREDAKSDPNSTHAVALIPAWRLQTALALLEEKAVDHWFIMKKDYETIRGSSQLMDLPESHIQIRNIFGALDGAAVLVSWGETRLTSDEIMRLLRREVVVKLSHLRVSVV